MLACTSCRIKLKSIYELLVYLFYDFFLFFSRVFDKISKNSSKISNGVR